MGKMVECIIDSVRVSLTSQERITVLKDVNAERYLAIWMGTPEVDSIRIALQDVALARPLTHDLFIETMKACQIRLVSCEIIALNNNTFYANLVLDQNNTQKMVDCRPSDGIALALRAKAPIFVNEDILIDYGILPEDILPLRPVEEESTKEMEADLQIFEDFLDQLGKDNPDVDPSGDPPADHSNT